MHRARGRAAVTGGMGGAIFGGLAGATMQSSAEPVCYVSVMVAAPAAATITGHLGIRIEHHRHVALPMRIGGLEHVGHCRTIGGEGQLEGRLTR